MLNITTRDNMITISASAKTKIKDLIYEEGNPNLALRTFVQGAGVADSAMASHSMK